MQNPFKCFRKAPAFIIDPLDLMGQGDDRNRLNPLALLNSKDSSYHTLIHTITDALIDGEERGHKRFHVNAAKVVFSGLIDTTLRSDIFRPEERDLATVFDVAAAPEGAPTLVMKNLGGLAARAATLLNRLSDRVSDEVLATVVSETRWLGIRAVRWTLSGPDFDLSGTGGPVKLVMPPYYSVRLKGLERLLAAMLAAQGQRELITSYISVSG